MKPRHAEILRGLLNRPTAPFHEQAMIDYVRDWAAELDLPLKTDEAGNVFVRYRNTTGRPRRWVFSAHVDHPGFVVQQQRGRTLRAEFIGGVREPYFRGSCVELFPPSGAVKAVVSSYQKRRDAEYPLCGLQLDEQADVPPGTLGMWDLPAARIRGRVLASRACDDVVGVAAALCAQEEIVRAGMETDATVCLTRAEEAGLVGCVAACRAGSVPRRSWIVGIETSKAQPRAALGDGVVIRVGDKARTFDPDLTAHLAATARDVQKRDGEVRYVRQLMPGGTCETTPYCVWGYRAGAVCLPLGNYHNMGPNEKIAAERIHLDDFESLVKLLVALPAGAAPDQAPAGLQKRLEDVYARRGDRL
ncbi:MAG: hypothetical protein ACOC93_02005 [Planctomycetota bacterium]